MGASDKPSATLFGVAMGAFVNALTGLSAGPHGFCLGSSEIDASMRELSSEENMTKGFGVAPIPAGSNPSETVTGRGKVEGTVDGALDGAGAGEDKNEFELTISVSAASTFSNAGA